MRIFGIFLLLLILSTASCSSQYEFETSKDIRPLSVEIEQSMHAKNMLPSDPIMLRIFKRESLLEVWKRTKTGRYALLKSYDICKWSGKVGPKIKEGDRQAPEGFYSINKGLMNPKSDYHLSFNLGFPNKYDRAHNRTGSFLMVHGACSSRGCYAMENDQIEEIYGFAREAFNGGQKSFQVQAFPFIMSAENMAENFRSPHYDFWKMLKEGYDHFQITHRPPKIDVCGKRYIFNAEPRQKNARFLSTKQCPRYTLHPDLKRELELKNKRDEARIARIRGLGLRTMLTGTIKN